jgi:hypothetical protein
MRFPRGIRGEFRAHCINFSRNGKREPLRSRAVRGQKWGNGARQAHQQTFTLKENPLKRSDLDDFVNCYFGGKDGSQSRGYSGNRHERKESERFKSFTYEELAKRDKLNLDIFWLKDESLEDSANLPAPDVIAAEIDSRIPIRSPVRASRPCRPLPRSPLSKIWKPRFHSSQQLRLI